MSCSKRRVANESMVKKAFEKVPIFLCDLIISEQFFLSSTFDLALFVFHCPILVTAEIKQLILRKTKTIEYCSLRIDLRSTFGFFFLRFRLFDYVGLEYGRDNCIWSYQRRLLIFTSIGREFQSDMNLLFFRQTNCGVTSQVITDCSEW